MDVHVDWPSQLRTQLAPKIERRLANVAQPACTLGHGVATTGADVAFLEVLSRAQAGNYPRGGWASVVAVNALQTWPGVADLLALDGHLYFAEVTEGPGQRNRPSFDVTGWLWASGLSVIDVDRPRIDAEHGTWELAIGVARHTPERLGPPNSST